MNSAVRFFRSRETSSYGISGNIVMSPVYFWLKTDLAFVVIFEEKPNSASICILCSASPLQGLSMYRSMTVPRSPFSQHLPHKPKRLWLAKEQHNGKCDSWRRIFNIYWASRNTFTLWSDIILLQLLSSLLIFTCAIDINSHQPLQLHL